MKSLIIFAALVGLSVSQLEPKVILTEFLDFVQIIPIRQIMDITNNHLDSDAEFGAGVKYLQSREWEELNDRLMATPEFQDFKKRLISLGVPVEFIHKFVRNMISRAKPAVIGDTISFEAYIHDIESIIPFDKIISMTSDKMQNSEVFKEFYDNISSKETYKLVEKLRSLPDAKLIHSQLSKMGIRVDEYLQYVYSFLHWGSP